MILYNEKNNCSILKTGSFALNLGQWQSSTKIITQYFWVMAVDSVYAKHQKRWSTRFLETQGHLWDHSGVFCPNVW